MSDTAAELKNELKKGLTTLQMLRDEVRLRLHLANMELKTQWNKIEPQLAEVEKKAEDVSEASRAMLNEALKTLETFRSALHSGQAQSK
jgi:hypothetical protein